MDDSLYSSKPLNCSTKQRPGVNDPSPGRCSKKQGRRLLSVLDADKLQVASLHTNGTIRSEELREAMRRMLDFEEFEEQNLDDVHYLALFYR
jgi:hypothetical protein